MAVSMPIRPLKLPSGVDRSMNGQVPDSMLADVDHKGKLLRVFALCMRALHLLAAVNGITLTTTGRGRSLERQRALFLERYEPCNYVQYLAAQVFKRGKVWDNEHNDTGHKYWRKRQLPSGGYPATAATPGTSNHGLFAADDMAEIVNGQVVSLRYSTLQWLYTNAPALGIAWELASEPWHVHTTAGDEIPAVVLELLGMAPDPDPPAPDPDPTPNPPAPTRNRTHMEDLMLYIGTTGDGVFWFGYPLEGANWADRPTANRLLASNKCFDVKSGKLLYGSASGSVQQCTEGELTSIFGPDRFQHGRKL